MTEVWWFESTGVHHGQFAQQEDTHMMTKQEAFDIAVRGLASQGFRRCLSEAGACVYNATRDDGQEMHCAAGWITAGIDIPLDLNSGHGIQALADRVPEVADRIGAKAYDGDATGLYYFLVRLQEVHDLSSIPQQMVEQLHYLGRTEGLDTSALDGVQL